MSSHCYVLLYRMPLCYMIQFLWTISCRSILMWSQPTMGCLNIKILSHQYMNSIIMIRQSHQLSIFLMGIPIPGRMVYIWLIGLCGVWLQSQISNVQTYFNDKYLKYFVWNCCQVNATTHHWSLVNIGSCNGLVPSGSKPLPEPMLTKVPVAIWCHWARIS